MKNSTRLSIFTALFFGLLSTTVANAQEHSPAEQHQVTPVFDTLPDGSVIDLSKFPFERSKPIPEPLKSVVKTDKKTIVPQGTSQTKPVHASRLKSAGLIKSLNDEASSFYTEKLDSIVRYDTYLLPQYDSIKTETTDISIDANGHTVERITKKIYEQTHDLINNIKTTIERDGLTGKPISEINYTWDIVKSVWVEETKYEYTYGNGNQTSWRKYNWNLLAKEWYLILKSESTYDENNSVLTYKYYDIEKDGEGVVSSKYEYTYDDKGANTLFLYCNNWDADLNTWLVQQKTESNYDQTGARTSYSSLTLNVVSNEWEYNYKYEYNYLPDGSIEETYFGAWNPDTKEFLVQTHARYKYDRLYENGKIVEEIKQDWRYDSWKYDWKKIYAYDQWGNQILYELYDPYWGDYGELKNRTISEFTESGQRIKLEHYVIDDDYFYLKGVNYYTYQRDDKDKILSATHYKWDENKREWLVDYCDKHSFPNSKKEVVDRYKYDVSGYSSTYTKGESIKLNYNADIGRYTGADESDGWKWQISYNEYLKVDEAIRLFDNQKGDKIKCYYNTAGQDTAWHLYDKRSETWEVRSKATLTYKDLDKGLLKITERWYGDYENDWFDYYYKDGKIIYDVARWYDKTNNVWTLQDSTVYTYNTLGQITSAESVLGEYLWKAECIFANDTLTINHYSKETLNDDWQLEYKDVCKVDPSIGMDQFQQVPAAVTDGGLEWIYVDFFFLGYGKILECTFYENEDFGDDGLKIVYKEEWFYSEASVLSGEAVINGYIFNTEQGGIKSVSVANNAHGSPAEGVNISLCARDDDFVLTSATTDSEGFYQFLGVPKGTFYLKVELEGYVQNSTHEIQVTDYLTIFEGKNFNVADGAIVTGMDEASDNEISIYPNPTTGKLTIETLSPVHSIVIYNMAGIKLAEFNRTTSIDLSGLGKGFYLIRVSTKKENRIQKIHVK